MNCIPLLLDHCNIDDYNPCIFFIQRAFSGKASMTIWLCYANISGSGIKAYKS